jgi:hypothetical protein
MPPFVKARKLRNEMPNYSRFAIHDLRSNAVHGVEEIFALRVDAHAELFPLAAQPLLQFRGTFARARSIGDYDHCKLALHYCLIDVHDTTISGGEYLRNASNDAGVVHPKHGYYHSVGRDFARTGAHAATCRKRLERGRGGAVGTKKRFDSAVQFRNQLFDSLLVCCAAQAVIDGGR